VYHTYFAANIRLVLDVEVQAGNQTASSYAQPEFWKYIDSLPAESRPTFVRGDCDWGTERMMTAAEERGILYLFKLKQRGKVKRLIQQAFSREDSVSAGQGWKGVEAELMLTGWSCPRRVIVLRRRILDERLVAEKKRLADTTADQQLALGFVEMVKDGPLYEYAVLVTSLADEILALGQHYRDRAGAENNFDELKNQWGWSGFTTHDLKRCQIMARIIALVYNWWSMFTRLAIPEKHAEAITSRPLLLNAVGKQTTHSGQTTVTVTSMHAKAPQMRSALQAISSFLATVRNAAEQLTNPQKWLLILSQVFVVFLKGRTLGQPQFIRVYPLSPLTASGSASSSSLRCTAFLSGLETETLEDWCARDALQSRLRSRARDPAAPGQSYRSPWSWSGRFLPRPFRDPSGLRRFGASFRQNLPSEERGSRPAEDHRPLECARPDAREVPPQKGAHRSPPG
jgi:hypothetical protein